MKTLYYNGTVYDGSQMAEAFIVEDGHFIFCGSNHEAEKYGYDEKTDLKGQFVCAGFNDSHLHLLNLGQSLMSARLAEHTDSLRGMMNYVREFRNSHDYSNGQWLTGRGWNQDYFTDVTRMPSRKDIDDVVNDIPVVLTRACGHSCVVNTRALEVCGITENTVSPDGGAIDYENGLFFDNAIDLISSRKPLPSETEIENMIIEACRLLNSYGITSVQSDDYCVFREIPFEVINEAYRKLEREGRLSVRVYEQSNFTDLKVLRRFVEAGNITGKGTDFFKIGPLKMLGDGSLGSRTAYLSRPYNDDPSTRGFPLFSDEQMNAMLEYANDHGMQIAVHAIGDGCLDQVMNAIDRALKKKPVKDHRHGIVHCQLSRADQLDRIAEMNLHVYAQSIFLDYDNHIVYDRAGEQLASTSYSWKTLMKKGVTVSNGSDAPVELPDVMKGIECAVTRTSMDGTGPYLKDEAFSVREAIDSFTKASAFASFEESFKGMIREGYLADFVVLETNPFMVKENELHDIKVSETYVNGKKVFG